MPTQTEMSRSAMIGTECRPRGVRFTDGMRHTFEERPSNNKQSPASVTETLKEGRTEGEISICVLSWIASQGFPGSSGPTIASLSPELRAVAWRLHIKCVW